MQTADLLAGSVNLTIPATVWGVMEETNRCAGADLAGNVGVSSDAVTVVLDTTAPRLHPRHCPSLQTLVVD